VADKHSSDPIVLEVCRDLELFVAAEVNLRRAALYDLEREINPLLSEDPKVVFRHVILKVYQQMEALKISRAFQRPVSREEYKDYYDIIEKPICLDDVASKIHDDKYTSEEDYLADFELIYENSAKYNGERSSISEDAATLLKAVKTALKYYSSK